jgi:hypothetical protein
MERRTGEMPSRPKKKVVKQEEAAATVQMIADGANTVLLVFPKGSNLKGTKTLSAAQVSKILGLRRSGSVAEIEGQCTAQCNIWCDPFRTVL